MSGAARKQPLYDQLVDVLTNQINNDLQPGDMLPSERELSERYGLSRTTVRLALQELERFGLVVRQHGRGTFVTNPSDKTANLLQSYSFGEQMRAVGRKPSTVTIAFDEIEATKDLAEHMGCHIGDKLFEIRRLRYADDVPAMIDHTYMPVRKFMNLTPDMISRRSLYDVFENEFHEIIRGADEEVYANIARAADAKLLDINEGDPVLDLVRHTYNVRNEVLEYSLSVARSDQFKYHTYYRIHD